MKYQDFLAEKRHNPTPVRSITKEAAGPGAFKRFFKGFNLALKKTWVPGITDKPLSLKMRPQIGAKGPAYLEDYLSITPKGSTGNVAKGTKPTHGFDPGLSEVTMVQPSPLEAKFYSEIARPVGSPGAVAGAGLAAGKYLPPIAVVGSMLAGVDAGFDIKGALKQRFISEPRQNKIFDDLANNDDMLKQVPRRELEDAFDTMKKITDNGESTTDKNLVRSFLRQSIAYDGVDYNTAKQMAETETAIKRTKQDDSTLSNVSRAIGSLATLTE
jgi:hypothetical protein